MRTLILNSTHVIDYNNATYRYKFSNQCQFSEDDYISVYSITMPYSNFNINANLYNNNTFGYILKGVTYNVVLDDGFYTIDDINSFLENTFIKNGHYLLNGSGDYVFFCQFSTNTSKYKIQFDSFPIPTSLPSGYTNPANVLYNTVTIPSATTIQLSILNNNFQNIIGFSTGNYPSTAQSTNYSAVSNILVNMTPVNTYIIRCPQAININAMPSDVIYSFGNPNTKFGSNMVVNSPYPAWHKLRAGTHSYLEVMFVDANFMPIRFQDNNICIQLLIKNKNEL